MSASDTSKPSIRTEAIAGVTTFFTMAYIVVVNPSILSTPGTGMAFSGVLTATVFLCFTFISHVGLYVIVGRAREVHPMMYVLGVVSIGLLLLEHVRF